MSMKFTIAQLAERTGKRRGTIEHWINHGVIVQGRVVRLGATKLGGRYELTEEGFEAFIAACNPTPVPIPETHSARTRRLEAGRAEALRLVGAEA